MAAHREALLSGYAHNGWIFFHLLVGLTIMPANISNNIVFKVCRNGTNRLFLLYERKYNINDRRMKKALVSGGAGFIGSHLCTRLINEGNRNILRSTGVPVPLWSSCRGRLTR